MTPAPSTLRCRSPLTAMRCRRWWIRMRPTSLCTQESSASGLQYGVNPTTVLLAGEGKEMEIVGACYLHFVVSDLSVDTCFLVSPVLRFDVVLGRCWLKEYQVIHDHNLDCLYLGRESRRRVFLSQAPGKKLPGHNIV
jgi:hypothetical protein